MYFILWALVAALVVLKVTGLAVVSWTFIVGAALVPVALFLVGIALLVIAKVMEGR